MSKNLNIILWIAQGLLAALFLSGAGMKLFMPADKLAAMWPWTAANRRPQRSGGHYAFVRDG